MTSPLTLLVTYLLTLAHCAHGALVLSSLKKQPNPFDGTNPFDGALPKAQPPSIDLVGEQEGIIPQVQSPWIQFADTDPARDYLNGLVRIGRARPDNDVIWYSLYWADKNRALFRDPIQVLGKAAQDMEYELRDPTDKRKGIKIPPGATQLIVLTSNSAGEMIFGPTVDIYDFVNEQYFKLTN
mmetsp:Transcript_18601/g.43342  ORF Transcript_18601/g.43342 Transcript_18601/m.43342 type:complete len:183 (+) Transcript_18601:50-598(+)